MTGIIRQKKWPDNFGKAGVSLLLFLVLMMEGCTPTSSKPIVQTLSPIGTLIPSQEVAFTATVAPTLAQPTTFSTIPATTAAMITETTTPPGNILKQDCFQLLPTPPENNDLTGTLVLGWYASNPSSFLLDLKTKTKKEWNKGLLSSYFTSPNGQWLAYDQDKEVGKGPYEVIVESKADIEKGTEKKLIVWKDPAWISIYGWLSNDILLIIKNRDPLVSTVALNPFTGEQEEFIPNYPEQPDVTFGTSSTFQFYLINVLPDPTLRTVAYQQLRGEGPFLVIWDRKMKQSRAELALKNPLYHDPLWSSDGENFVIPLTTRRYLGSPKDLYPLVEDWFELNQNGQTVQVTHFGDFFPNPYIGRARRSPNGRFIAFWLTVQFQPVQERLAILDLENQMVMDTCIPGSLRGDAREPIWSPDSNYIAVMNEYKANSGHVLIANLSGRWAADVAEDGIPRGWLVEDTAH